MRQIILSLLTVCVSLSVQAQSPISIVRTDMPNINDTFRYSITDNLLGLIDLDDTGEGMVWNYATLGSLNQRLDTLVDPVLGTPLVYNITFSNFFDMDHFATLAGRNVLGSFNQNFVSIENVYDFYRETNGFFANVGLGLTINGFPLTSTMEPRDMIYEFPLEFGDEDESFAQYGVDVPQFGYFGQKISRKNTVDGWGELTTRYGTFNTLRVTTILNITDTLSAQGFGFEQPRPTEFEVKWLAKNVGTPLLTVRGQIIFGQKVVSTVEYLDSLRGFTVGTVPNPLGMNDADPLTAVSVYPNPATSEFVVRFNSETPVTYGLKLMDIAGRSVVDLGNRTLLSGDHTWRIATGGLGLQSGVYHLVITTTDGRRSVQKVMLVD